MRKRDIVHGEHVRNTAGWDEVNMRAIYHIRLALLYLPRRITQRMNNINKTTGDFGSDNRNAGISSPRVWKRLITYARIIEAEPVIWMSNETLNNLFGIVGNTGASSAG